MEYLVDNKRELELANYHNRVNKRIEIGRKIIWAISIINVLLAVYSAVVDFNIWWLIARVVFSVALLFGRSWMRYIFAVGAAASAFWNIHYVLTYEDDLTGKILRHLPEELVLMMLILAVFYLICTIMLYFSKNINAYFYTR